MTDVSQNKVIITIPIYKDWDSVSKLLLQVDRQIETVTDAFRIGVLLIDDGAEDKKKPIFESPLKNIDEIQILRLRRNLGHQRAIAIGLSYIHAKKECDAVLVMDGDGEDTPEGVVTLLREFERKGGRLMVFAKRQRRTENLVFRVCYQLYKMMHWILTGRRIQVGNFSILPREHLECLVAAPELWNHYAASATKLKIPTILTPIDRGYRIAGRSTMNFVSFVIHGLSAISVYAEEVGVRMMVFCGFLVCCLSLALLGIFSIRLLTNLAIPGWATNAFGMSLVLIFQLLIIALIIVVITLKGRSSADFIPMRDFPFFVKEEETLL